MKKVKNYKLKVRTFLKKLFTLNFLLLTNLKGFTLIEIVMIIVISSIAIPTLLLLLGQGAKYGVDAEIRVTETNLAQQLMEEIKSKCWDETKVAAGCGGVGSGSTLGFDPASIPAETAGDPTTYDDVDDYIAGVPSVSLGGITYTRTVQVCYVPSANLNDTSTCSTVTNYKRISVTVTDPPNSRSVEIVTVVTNY